MLIANTVSCGSDGVNIKVYSLDAERGGLIREQEQELILFKDAHKKFFCESKEDLKTLIDDYRACKQLCKGDLNAK